MHCIVIKECKSIVVIRIAEVRPTYAPLIHSQKILYYSVGNTNEKTFVKFNSVHAIKKVGTETEGQRQSKRKVKSKGTQVS